MFNDILVYPLFNLLLFLYTIVHDFGIAIILFTILVRLLLWPLVNKQLHSQKAMQNIAPEVAKLRAQAKGDRQLESKLLMELYKERGISPFSSFLPLLIQLPLFLALFAVLKDIVHPDLIQQIAYEPLRSVGAVKDIIAHHDAFHPSLLGLIDMAKPSVLLAVTSAACQYFQTKQLSPKKIPGDAQSQAMSAMVIIFPFITGFIALTLPAALALYWTVTSLVAIVQQSLILKQDVKEMEGEK